MGLNDLSGRDDQPGDPALPAGGLLQPQWSPGHALSDGTSASGGPPSPSPTLSPTTKAMEQGAVDARGADGGSANNGPDASTEGQLSAPASPCVPRRPPQTLSLDSRIPQPLTSPTPLRRSGSLRVPGEKLALTSPGSRGAPTSGRGSFGARTPGANFPSITEAGEQWMRSLRRGSGDGPAASPATTPAGHGSCLRHERHHRSLQSLNSRPVSKDSYPHTPTTSPEDLDHLPSQNLNRFLLDHARDFGGDRDDLDSLRSYGSNCSTQSACDHSQFARNGTTFSGRRMKYVVHCSSHPEPNEYLTPTQRANQQIRRLKALVDQARKDMEAKDENIFKLTKEVVELRLLRDETDAPSKTTRTTAEDSPVCKVVTPLESENCNSTSLSDSGHFDDAFSLTPAQSAHSPGRRHVTSTPESERMAEMYQRKIEEVTKKQGEKSMEDRKCLVDMYEKKMEDMSRKSIEKFHLEKNDLIQMYEKKIEDIVKRQQEKIQEEKKLVQEFYEKKIESLSERREHESEAQVAEHNLSLQALNAKLQDAENHIASLTQQLDEASLRYNDLQHELFQSREKSVAVEEEVETLRKTVVTLEKDLSEKQQALVHLATLESELQVLQRHMEEQHDTSEQISQLENELAILKTRLKEEKSRGDKLESERADAQMQHDEEHKEAGELKARFEAELTQLSNLLSNEQRKSLELEEMSTKLNNDHQKAMALNSQLRCELDQLAKSFKEKEQEWQEMELCKSELANLYEEEQEKITCLKSSFKEDLEKLQKDLLQEKQKNENFEKMFLELQALKEEEARCNSNTISELQRELSSAKCQLDEGAKRDKVKEDWESVVQTLKEEAAKKIQQIQNLTSHSSSLEEELGELRKKLDSENNKSLIIQDRERDIEELKELLNRSQEEAEDHLQQVHSLTDQLQKAQKKILTVSNLLTEERQKSEELLMWKSKAENIELSLKSLQEDFDKQAQKLQYFSGMQDEVSKLKHSLANEKEEVKALLIWREKAEDLEEKLIVLTEEAALRQNGQLQKLSTNPFNDEVHTDCFNNSVSNEGEQKILLLETEVQKLRESLDQSYWAQSEKETVRLELEKAVAEQAVKFQKLENEVQALNQSISALKVENEELSKFKLKHLVQDNHSFPSQNGECKNNNVASFQAELHDADQNGESTHDSVLTIAHLKAQIESMRKALADQEERHTDINLKMYLKGQEAAKFERKDQVLEMAAHAPEKVSVPELLTQLAETEKELEKVKAMYRQLAEGQANSSSSPEATLLFLKSAFYYFLTDEANCQNHLHAIESILGFTDSEKQSIDTLTYIRR